MAFAVADIPDLTGCVVVVTGANGGLGLQTAGVLAARGAHVVLAARDQAKTARAVERITRTTPDARLSTVPLDLGSLASVGEAAAAILAEVPRVDVLVNSAGVESTYTIETMPQREWDRVIDVTLTGNDQLIIVDLGALQSVGGNITISGNLTLQSVDMGSLATVGGSLTISGNPALNAILITMVPLVYVAAMSGAIHLSNYYLESLQRVGS